MLWQSTTNVTCEKSAGDSKEEPCEDFSNDPMMPGSGGELIRGFLDAFGTHVRTHVR
jgi:hypothetical protein